MSPTLPTASAPTAQSHEASPTAAAADAPKPAPATAPPTVPDFAAGVPITDFDENVPRKGTFRGEPVVGICQNEQIYVVGGKCSHFGAPLEQGRVDGHRIMCPWHHACFSIVDGATLKAPGLAPLTSYAVRVEGGKVYVDGPKQAAKPAAPPQAPAQVSIVGAGAAAFSAVAELRAQGYRGRIDVFGGEQAAPYDRTKLSKAFLKGEVPEAKLPLEASFLAADASPIPAPPVTWHLGQQVVRLAPAEKKLTLADGTRHSYGALILATGAKVRWPKVQGEKLPHVHVLRSLADARALQQSLAQARRVAIVGASFIGLEAASVLRQRGLQVHVIAHNKKPLQHVLGSEVAQALYQLHQEQGVIFHVGAALQRIEAEAVILRSKEKLAADVVLLATGVEPDVALAEASGLHCDNGVRVDAQLRTSSDGIWAAGDVANWPYANDGNPIRIEHWSVAEQMGRVAARNVLGHQHPFRDIPFFWTEHYHIKLRYVGHARRLIHHETFGSVREGRAAVALYDDSHLAAVATIGCDDISMACEAALRANHEALALNALRTL